MRNAIYIVYLVGSMFLFSCGRSAPPISDGESLEKRLLDLEQQLNVSTQRASNDDIRQRFEHDLTEIRSLGLVDRAARDFSSRLTKASVVTWTIGYLVDTNTVWCDFRYRSPDNNETLQQEFGYSRTNGTNWNLMWQAR